MRFLGDQRCWRGGEGARPITFNAGVIIVSVVSGLHSYAMPVLMCVRICWPAFSSLTFCFAGKVLVSPDCHAPGRYVPPPPPPSSSLRLLTLAELICMSIKLPTVHIIKIIETVKLRFVPHSPFSPTRSFFLLDDFVLSLFLLYSCPCSSLQVPRRRQTDRYSEVDREKGGKKEKERGKIRASNLPSISGVCIGRKSGR